MRKTLLLAIAVMSMGALSAQQNNGGISAEMMKDFANMLGIEFVHIGKDTTLESLEEKLLVADLIWKLR